MWDTIGEFWIQTRIETNSRKVVLCILTLATRKLYILYLDVLHIQLMLYYRRCIFSVLELDSRYNWRVTLQNTHCNLFPIGHFYEYSVHRPTTWKLRVVLECSAYRTTAIVSETFLVCFRVSLEIRMESYGLRQASVVFWYDFWYDFMCECVCTCISYSMPNRGAYWIHEVMCW